MLRLRRGLGVLFVIAGVVHAALMAAATLYSLGKIHVLVSARLWSELTFGHFLGLVLGSGLYLTLGYWRANEFYFEPLLDFLAGVAAFDLILTGTVFLLAKRLLPPFFSPVPSAFLIAYGAGLLSGRRFGFWQDSLA